MRGINQPAWEAPRLSRRRRCCTRPPLRFCLAWTLFVLLLTFTYRMSRPLSPKSTQFIGFQAFDMLRSNVQPGQAASNLNDDAAVVQDGPSFPLNVYAPLVPNPVPLTEITVMPCFPLMLQNCKPLTSADQDARLGPWVRVDRPLDPDTAQSKSEEKGGVFGDIGMGGLFNSIMGTFEAKYIFYRRSRRSDVPRIVDLRLVETGTDGKPLEGDYAGWHRIKLDLKSTFFHILQSTSPMHLYYRTLGGTAEDKLQQDPAEDKEMAKLDPITEVDVTYGPGPVWPGFSSVGIVTKAAPDVSRARVTLSARRKPQPRPQMPVSPLFHSDGTFKILQLGDLHLSVLHEKCRDVGWESATKPCEADTDTIAMIERWLEAEKPDLVVFSGDQLNGQTTSWDEKSVIPKHIVPIINRKIAWTSIMGNHDSQSGVLTRAEQQLLLSRLPYSLSLVGPPELHEGNGAGNYYMKLHSPTPDNMHLFTLYFVDSGEAAPREMFKPWQWSGYDWIRWDQIDWLLNISNKISKIARPYTPDGAKDLPALWNRTGLRGANGMGQAKRQGTHLSKPKALLFTHIPLPEAFSTPDKDKDGHQLSWGPMAESATLKGAQKKGGIFSAILAQQQERDIIGFFHGHMHNNAGCRRTSGVWICFNGGSSFAGYGKTGFERRARVISVTKWGEQVETWHRMESTPGKVEPHLLYEEGAE